jgi:hypothetical protein
MEILKEDDYFVIKKGKDKVRLSMTELDHLWHRINSVVRGENRGVRK